VYLYTVFWCVLCYIIIYIGRGRCTSSLRRFFCRRHQRPYTPLYTTVPLLSQSAFFKISFAYGFDFYTKLFWTVCVWYYIRINIYCVVGHFIYPVCTDGRVIWSCVIIMMIIIYSNLRGGVNSILGDGQRPFGKRTYKYDYPFFSVCIDHVIIITVFVYYTNTHILYMTCHVS